MRRDRFFKIILMVFVVLLVTIESLLLFKQFKDFTGKGLNRRAWRRSYTERHLTPPPSGQPREGFWGVHLSPVRDTQLQMILPERHEPGVWEIDRWGRQYAYSRKPAKIRMMIIGGSVAAGAYASSPTRTYFHQLAMHLRQLGYSVEIIVQATGAWTSVNEFNALRYRGLDLKPDLVVFLNGLNDMILRKELSEDQRVAQYLHLMKEARDLAVNRGIRVAFAPQPFLSDKLQKTPLESLIQVQSYKNRGALIRMYSEARKGLRELQIPGQVFYLDTSGAFNNEIQTTFADMWHFSDVGHALLGERLAEKLNPILYTVAHVKNR